MPRVGPDDQVEVLLWVVEEWLNDYFRSDPDWRNEPVRLHPTAKLYQEVIAALGEGLKHAKSSDGALREKATTVAEGFRTILNRVSRAFLEFREIPVVRTAEVKRAFRRRSA